MRPCRGGTVHTCALPPPPLSAQDPSSNPPPLYQDVAYRSQLRALRPLLPQHMGVRDDLGLRRPHLRIPSSLAAGLAWARFSRSHPPPDPHAAAPHAAGLPLPVSPDQGGTASAPPAAAVASLRDSALLRNRWVSAWRIGRAWRRWSLGPCGAGAYLGGVRALHLLATGRTPMEKGEAALAALSLLAKDAAACADRASRAAAAEAAARAAPVVRPTEEGREAAGGAAEALGRGGPMGGCTGARASLLASFEASSGDSRSTDPPPPADEVAADDLLPLLVFALARARVPNLPAHVRCVMPSISAMPCRQRE